MPKQSVRSIFKNILRFTGLFLLFVVVGSFLVFFKVDRDPDILEASYTYTTSNFFDFDGMRIHYRDEGNGPALVLLHGTGSSLHTWDTWTGRLRDSFRVISLDLPGYGLTGPDPTNTYTANRYTEVTLALANQLGLDRFHLAGNSMGGGVAWYLAARYPDRVNRMVLLAPSGLPKSADYSDPLVFRLAKVPVLRSFVRWVTPRFLVEESLLDVYYNDRLVTDTLVTRYYDLQLRAGNRQAFIDRLQGDFFAENRPSLKDVQAPTLIIWGEADAWLPVEHAPFFRDSIPRAELLIYSRCGHLPMEEMPVKSAVAARRFLRD